MTPEREVPKRILMSGLLALMLAAFTVPCAAQGAQGTPADVGRWEYENQCAVCHGEKGRGDGPLAGVLTQKVSDLTHLKKNNNGQMPVEALTAIIDGRQMVTGHGTRDMPIWGKRLGDQAQFWLGPGASKAQVQKFVGERIRALIGYIEKLQVK